MCCKHCASKRNIGEKQDQHTCQGTQNPTSNSNSRDKPIGQVWNYSEYHRLSHKDQKTQTCEKRQRAENHPVGASTHQLYWGQNHFETFQPLYEQGHNVDIRENTHDHARSHTILIDYQIHFLLNKLRNTRNKCRVNSAPAPASLWKPEWDPKLIGWVCYGHLEFAELEGTFMKIARCLSVWMKALFFRFLGHHFSLCKELPGPVSESNRKADQL